MFKYTIPVFLMAVTLAQWSNSDTKGLYKKYPPLPRSIPVTVTDGAYRTTATVPATSPGTGLVTLNDNNATVASPSLGAISSSEASNCTSMFSCADCNTAQVCKPSGKGFTRAFTLPCPHTAPYCDFNSGSCTTVPDSRCGRTDSFLCLDNGHFPDPLNCSVYHVCSDYQAQMFECAEGQYFDPSKGECWNGATCSYNTNCAGSSEIKIEMGQSNYFTYCSNGLPIVVSRCPGEYKLNATSQLCEPICEKEGLMTDLDNCTRFFKCSTLHISANLSVPIRENLPCPSGEAFEPMSFQCIPKNETTCKL